MTDIHEVLARPVRKIGSKQVLFSVKIELISFQKMHILTCHWAPDIYFMQVMGFTCISRKQQFFL